MDKTKYFGKVYTPPSVVAHMLDTLFAESLECMRICDPACGSGDFLVPVAEEICKRYLNASGETRPQYLSTLGNLTGYDIDGEAADHCRQRLSEVAGHILGQHYPVDFWRILESDAMDAWTQDEETFDWVVGNPPYVRIQNLEAERRNRIYGAEWKYFRGASDLYIVFYELGLKLLKDRGNLLFISPSGWIRNEAGAKMRNDVDTNHGIVSLWDFRDHQVFHGVSTYTCIAHIRKGGYDGDVRAYQWNGNSFTTSCKLIKSGVRWAIVGQHAQQARMTESVRLGDIADIHVGIQTLADKVFILPAVKWESDSVTVELNGMPHSLEKGAVRRILKASVLREGQDKVERVIIYPYDPSGKLMDEEEFIDRFPRAYSWLSENKDRLLARDKGTFPEAKWYGYGREVGIRSALGRKILTSGMNPVPNFQICNDPDILFYSGYCIKPRNGVDLEALKDALNTPEMDQHIRSFAQPFRGGWFSYAKRYIQDFPVPVRLSGMHH